MGAAGIAGVSGATGTTTGTSPWRKGSKAYCAQGGDLLYRNPIWSDARGVYLITSTGSASSRIDFNDGSGWIHLTTLQKSPANPALTGFSNGSLVAYGSSACAITFVDQNATRCSAASSQITSVSIVDSQLAYAVYKDRALRFDGTFWTQWGEPLNGHGATAAWGVWASKDAVAVVAGEDEIFLQEGMKMQLQTGFPHGDYRAVWGFGPNDIWVANELGQLVHFDGQSWSVVATVPGACPAVRSLWGKDGVVFVSTDHTVLALKNRALQVLADYPCDGQRSVMGLWGNSTDEVFFASQTVDPLDASCSGIRLKWFDGKTVSPL